MGLGSSKPEQNDPNQIKSKGEKPQQTAPKKKSQIVHCIPEGTGGTFRIRDPNRNRPSKPKHSPIHELDEKEYLGTEYCKTGVGVYFAVGKNMCFCAHMRVIVEGRSPDAGLKPGEGVEIRKDIRNRLQVESERAGWSLDQVDKKSLILICALGGHEGFTVGEAVLDFLWPRRDDKAPPSNRGKVYFHEHGFVTQAFRPKEHITMSFDRREPDDTCAYRQHDGYDMVYKEMRPGKWTFTYQDGWIPPKVWIEGLDGQVILVDKERNRGNRTQEG